MHKATDQILRDIEDVTESQKSQISLILFSYLGVLILLNCLGFALLIRNKLNQDFELIKQIPSLIPLQTYVTSAYVKNYLLRITNSMQILKKSNY